jgi:hypothetical protein
MDNKERGCDDAPYLKHPQDNWVVSEGRTALPAVHGQWAM